MKFKDCLNQDVEIGDKVILTMGSAGLRLKTIATAENRWHDANYHDDIFTVVGIKRSFHSNHIVKVNKLLE